MIVNTARKTLVFVLVLLLGNSVHGQTSFDEFLQNEIESVSQQKVYAELKQGCVASLGDLSQCNYVFWVVYKSLKIENYEPPNLTKDMTDYLLSLDGEDVRLISNNSMINYLEMIDVVYSRSDDFIKNTENGSGEFLASVIENVSCDATVVSKKYSVLHSYLQEKCVPEERMIYFSGYNFYCVDKLYFGPGDFKSIKSNIVLFDEIYNLPNESISEFILIDKWDFANQIKLGKLLKKLKLNARLKFLVLDNCNECGNVATDLNEKEEFIKKLKKKGLKLLKEIQEGDFEYVEFIYHG
jgi:hypothetical protein